MEAGWKADSYLSQLKDSLNNIKLISLDIFDTLIFRTCGHPADVFFDVGEKAVAAGLIRKGIGPYEFQQLRILVEEQARVNQSRMHGKREVSLLDIYAEFPGLKAESAEMIELEIESEIMRCYLNPSMLSLIEEAKKLDIRVVLISDMYFTRLEIERILTAIGFPLNDVSDIFMSNEYGCDKLSGQLFDRAYDHFSDIDRSNIVHIGDNKNSDVLMALQKGIQAVHYNVIPVDFDDIFTWEQLTVGDLAPELLSLRKLASSLNGSHQQDQSFWFRLGASVLGPVFTLFTHWVVKTCVDEKINEIMPLMREGRLFKQLIENEGSFIGLDLKVAELYVSRQATYIPSLEELDEEEIFKLFQRRNFTLRDLFEMFDLIEESEPFSDYLNYDLNELNVVCRTQETTMREELTSFLLSPSIQRKVRQHIDSKRKLFISYLKQNISDFSNWATVDLGFKGTIQKAIEKALEIEGISSNAAHLLTMGDIQTRSALLGNVDIRGFLSNAGENKDLLQAIMRSPDCLEELTMGADGSTVGYKQTQTNILPIQQKNLISVKEIMKKQECQAGIYVFQKLWLETNLAKKGSLEISAARSRELLKMLNRLIEFPTFQEASLLGNLHHEDNFGSKKLNRICNEEHEKLLSDLTEEKFLEHTSYKFSNGNVYWPQAIIARMNRHFFFNEAVSKQSGDSYLAIMNRMVKHALLQENDRFIVYGAGEAGQSLLKVLKLYPVRIECIVDRKEELWGKKIDGIEVCSLQDAIEAEVDHYLIASFEFAEDIERSILKAYQAIDRSCIVIKPLGGVN